MFDHIGLKVRDLDVSARFYEAALAPLKLKLSYRDDTFRGFGGERTGLYLQKGRAGEGVHLAFPAESRAAVDRFHAAGLGAGGKDNGAPGLRPDYGASYYAAFVIDPDGNNIEAVCLSAAG